MGIYKQGLNRKQQLMFPPSLDELVDEDNVVRAIEEYVNILDISKLNIKTKRNLIKDGQPAFHPRLLLKIYIYGYLNKIRSSRKLELEINRNIEMIWLTQGLRPSYKTIANFRKNNPKALQTIFKEFSLLLKDLKLITGLGKEQYNKTDKDATVMSKPAHNLMAYNSQIAVDNTYKFIVATDISTNGYDLDQLHNMATRSKEITDNPNMVVTADKGYYSSKELKKCIEDGIETVVPARATAKTKKIQSARFSKNQFIYNHEDDLYICPNNQELKKIEKQYERDGRMLDVYRISSSYCRICPLKKNCLSDKTPNKQVYRWEHEDIIDNYIEKMNTPETKAIVRKRGSIVEHPFGTIKRTLGWDHFLVRTKKKVLGENALIMFTYNFKRLLNLIGITLFKKLCKAIKENDLIKIREEIEAYILAFGVNLAYLFEIFLFLQNIPKKMRYLKI